MRSDSADLPAKDGPASDQDAIRGHQEQRAADGVQSTGSSFYSNSGSHETKPIPLPITSC